MKLNKLKLLNLYIYIFAIIIFAFASTNCSDDDDSTPNTEESIDSHVCKHLSDGPIKTITASTEANDNTTSITNDHHRYDIILNTCDTTNNNCGYLKVSSSEAGEFVLFLNDNPTIDIYKSDLSTKVNTTFTGSSDDCNLIAAKYEMVLDVATYYIYISSTTIEKVNAVLAHHDEDEEEHEHND